MDKLNLLKKGLVAAAAVAAMALTPEPAMSPERKAESIQQILEEPESVQVLYRPVMQLKRLPESPLQRGDKSWIWWSEQVKRCVHGWLAPNGHWLNGYQYFFINFMKIPVQDKERNIAEWSQPYFRDNDETIFSFLWRNTARTLANGKQINARNHVEAKCRSIGWTQITLLGVAMHTFIFRPDRAIGMGYSDDEVIGIERLWFQESWAKLPAFLRTWEGHILEPLYNNKDNFVVGWKDPANPKIVKEHNTVQFKIIADKAGVFKGQRLNLIIAIEAGKWKGDTLKNFYSENLDCLEMGDYKWGMFLIGGTSNVIINKSSNYKEIYFRCEAFNATRHFTPKTMCLYGYIDMKTGVSQVDKALKYILAMRKLKESDPQAYQQYIIENPLTDLECFTPNESFAYDTARLQAQVGYVKTNGFDGLWRRGRLDYEWDAERNRKTGRIKFYEDPMGKWQVNLEGLPNKRFKNLHIAGVDDTYKGAEEEKLRARDSRNCMVIYRQPTAHNIKSDMPVAVFLHQTPDMDDIYEEFTKGLKYYDVNQCLYEYNHDGFVKYLRDAGEIRRLYYVGTKPGLAIKGKIKTELTYLGHAYFRDGRFQNITSLAILEALMVWGSKANTDVGSAFHLVLHLLHETKDHEVTKLVNGVAESEDGSVIQRRVMLGASSPTAQSGGSPGPFNTPGGGESFGQKAEKPSRRIQLGPKGKASLRVERGYKQRTQYA